MAGEEKVVADFREYLRIKTVQPDPDYDGAMSFLRKMADDVGLPYQIIQLSSGRPVFLMSWEGESPDLSTVLLNSHTDVVPVFPDHWKVDPFSADKMENGDIYARGTQDMKSVGIQYIEAIRRLKAAGKRLRRTVHLSFVPDEEIGGHTGMATFVKDERFKQLNIGFALDEGLANPTDSFTVFYGEKSAWWLRVKCPGKPGHGSRFIQDTAGEKVHKVISRLLELRATEEKRLHSDNCLKLGDVTTVNLTKLEGGVQVNVVPDEFVAYFDIRLNPQEDLVAFEAKLKSWFAEIGEDVICEFDFKGDSSAVTSTDEADPWWRAFSSALHTMGCKYDLEIFPAGTDSSYLREGGVQVNVVPDEFVAYFDIRLSPKEDLAAFEAKLKTWCAEAGEDVTFGFLQKGDCSTLTSTDEADPWWRAFSSALHTLGCKYETEIFPAGTDSRFLREIGLPALGFSPMNNTPILLHDHNEFLNENVFLKGIGVYEQLIQSIANVPKF